MHACQMCIVDMFGLEYYKNECIPEKGDILPHVFDLKWTV